MTEQHSRNESTPFPVLVIGDTGGVHTRTRALAMAGLGYDIHTLTPRGSGIPALNESLPEGVNPETPAGLVDLARRLKSIAGEITHVHYASSLGAWLFVALGDRRPLLVSVMGGDILFEEQGNPSFIARWLVQQVLFRADFITAKSDYLVARLIDMGIEENRVQKILWGVDTVFFQPADGPRPKERLGLRKDALVIFSPRILRRFYRTDILIRALPLVLDEYPGARLIIAEYEADPVYKRELELLARELGVWDAVVMAGVIAHEKMQEYYQGADVAVGIPPSDGFPQTVLEAMACGTPNVVARLRRYEEILKEKESAIFVTPTAEGVSQGILEIFRDRKLAVRLRQNGLEIIRRKAELKRDAARVSEIYQRLHARRPSSPRPLMVRLAMLAALCGLAIRNSVFRLGKERRSVAPLRVVSYQDLLRRLKRDDR